MKKILCFGDSNTFGYIPSSGLRYDKNTRWTGVLNHLCAGEFEIIEAGCNNRTCYQDNPDGDIFTGYKALPKHLDSSIDCVILALGINDTQKFYDFSLADLMSGLQNLANMAKAASPDCKILVLIPTELSSDVLNGGFSALFNNESIVRSKGISHTYEDICLKNKYEFVDLNKIVSASKLDGLHYEPETHRIIADAVYKKISDIFS